MKITNSKQYDMFIIMAKAFGNEVSGSSGEKKDLPKASFAGIETFLSGG